MWELRRKIVVIVRDSLIGPILLFYISLLFIFLLHPRLGIRDVDGYAYIMGARSIHSGRGYYSLIGEPFNTWPPGYSLLLSLFRDPASASLIINYLAFGAAISLLYYLARRLGWTWQAAIGFSVALASGFFQWLASMAHADMLTYALFLFAICCVISGPARALPGLIWPLLIPVKLIAIVFLPASIVADWTTKEDWKRLLPSYVTATTATAMSVAGLLAFNFLTTKTWTGEGHSSSSFTVLASSVQSFIASVFRSFLFSWYGTIMAPFPMIAFVVCTLLAAICLISLRPTQEGKWCRMYGIGFLVFASLLLCVRSFDFTTRLVGYGLIILIIGFRPAKWANKIWILYGLVSLLIGIINGMITNSLGSNDLRYGALVAELRSYYLGSDIVATNSFHILDLYANIPSMPVANYADADAYGKFFWVTLPQFDAIATSVWPMPRPGKGWCEEKEFFGGVLFARCK
jgi:hypothetical protein